MDNFEPTFSHYQLGANASNLGGWDNAMAIASAIEEGDRGKLEELVEPYPEGWELVERVVEVSAAHR